MITHQDNGLFSVSPLSSLVAAAALSAPVPAVQTPTLSLYKGDALWVLPHLPSGSVDAVLTDPPYCSGAAGLAGKQAPPAQKYQNTTTSQQFPALLGDGKDQRSFYAWASLWLSECWRIAKDGSPIMVFTDWRQLPVMTDAIQAAGWHWLGVFPWIKPTCRPQKGRFRAACEYVVWGCKGRLPTSGPCLPGVFQYGVKPSERVHITTKPQKLIEEMLAIVPQGGTVLDPFHGGGTTGRACAATGRKCIAVERSKAYVAIGGNDR